VGRGDRIARVVGDSLEIRRDSVQNYGQACLLYLLFPGWIGPTPVISSLFLDNIHTIWLVAISRLFVE